jgi:ribosomal protein S18 acetylase RimI-like enzyme
LSFDLLSEVCRVDVLVKKAEYDQFPIVVELIHKAFEQYKDVLIPPSGAHSETVESIANKVNGRGGAVLVWHNHSAVGCALYYFNESYMYIGRVSVSPLHRGSGIGSKIISELEQLALEQGCGETRVEVRRSLPANLTFYKSQGYMAIAEIEYPQKTDSWYIMKKELNQQLPNLDLYE